MTYTAIKYVRWICTMTIKTIQDLATRIMMIKVANLTTLRDWEHVYRMNFSKDIVALTYKVAIKVRWFPSKAKKCLSNCSPSWTEEAGIVCWKVSDVAIAILIRICEKRHLLSFNLTNYHGDWRFSMALFCVAQTRWSLKITTPPQSMSTKWTNNFVTLSISKP